MDNKRRDQPWFFFEIFLFITTVAEAIIAISLYTFNILLLCML